MVTWHLVEMIGIGCIGLVFVVWFSVKCTRKEYRRIESLVSHGVLTFTRIGGGGSTIDVRDITSIIDISDEGGMAYELVTRDGGRVILKVRPVLNGFRVFKRELQRANPRIRSGRRERRCHACDADLRARMDRCPDCGEPIGKPVGRL